MQDDEEAQDAVDVQPSTNGDAKSIHTFPWVIVIVGIALSAFLMAAITLSTVPLSVVTSQISPR